MAQVVKSGKAIRLEAVSPMEKRRELRPWKARGFRIADPDGQTVWHEKEAILQVVLETFAYIEADICLFGSRAAGKQGKLSDYDVGYLAEEGVSAALIAELREKLDEMPIPAHVEVVNFSDVQDAFLKQILDSGEFEIWKKKSKNSIFIS